jgi:hypothetical protein
VPTADTCDARRRNQAWSVITTPVSARGKGLLDVNCIWWLRSRTEVALRIAEQAFEDDAETGVLESPFAAREEDRLVVAELLQPRPTV